MKELSKEEILKGIKEDLKIEDEVIEEGYVAMPKTVSIVTDRLSERALNAHKELYHGYVKKLNNAAAELDAFNKQDKENADVYRDIKKEEIFNLNAVYLHELYFANIGSASSELKMDTIPYMRLSRDFGTFNDWQYDFIMCALSARNGWVVTAFNTFLQKYMNFFIDSHDSSIPMGCYPVIVVDVWEHAYFKDYTVEKGKYIYAMMKELRWDVIDERFQKAEKILKSIA